METILNLAWLVITIAGVLLWRFRWFASRENQRARIFPEAVAIVCVIALLFPVISLTDDLHPDILIVDSASAKRNLCLLVAGGSHAPNPVTTAHGHTNLAVMVRSLARVELAASSLVLSLRIPRTISLAGVPLGRSPPALR